MKIVFTGGGTGGHVSPALAVMEEARRRYPDAELLFLGRKNGDENRPVREAGFSVKELDVIGLRRSLSPKNIKAILLWLKAAKDAERILRTFVPDAVFATGGYVSAPVLSAAVRCGIPTVMHESNRTPGLVTKIFAKKVDLLLTAYPSTAAEVKAKRSEWIGCPLRSGFRKIGKEAARRKTGIAQNEKLVVSFGGSLGAAAINTAVIDAMKTEEFRKSGIRWIHGCGKRYFDAIRKSEQTLSLSGGKAEIRAYLDDVGTLMQTADVVVTRAGAMTVAEICSIGVPAILIPSPNVTGNHQLKNAEELAKVGAASLLEEKDLTAEKLLQKLRDILGSPAQCDAMRKEQSKNSSAKAAEKALQAIVKASQERK